MIVVISLITLREFSVFLDQHTRSLFIKQLCSNEKDPNVYIREECPWKHACLNHYRWRLAVLP